MSNWTGCRVAVLMLMVVVVFSALGFATGFVTHAVVVTGTPEDMLLPGVGPSPGDLSASEVEPAEDGSSDSSEFAPPEPTSLADDGSPSVEEDEALQLFWEAWNLIERDYYGDLPTDEEMTNGAIRGAINTLDDPYTAFVDPNVAGIRREDDTGSFEGIGAYVTMRNGRLMVVSTFKGQPAEEAGVRRDDIVLQVDDTVIMNMSIYEAISLIRGPAGTPVRLTIEREGEEPFEVEMTRARIEIPTVESEMRDDGVAYVSLFEFSSDSSLKLQEAIQALLDQDSAGLILDLRGNPGGWLNEAVQVTGLFLPKDEVVLIERFKDGTEETYQVPNTPVAPEIPMVVLVDAGSASASEIVAGALQDYDRAVIVGEKTFGKGSVQWAHELSNGAELRVTIARWFTPEDRAIHGEGLEPDIEVELTQEDLDNERDPQLDRAIEYLLTGE
jgi:carboxyl-terminal processing protease